MLMANEYMGNESRTRTKIEAVVDFLHLEFIIHNYCNEKENIRASIYVLNILEMHEYSSIYSLAAFHFWADGKIKRIIIICIATTVSRRLCACVHFFSILFLFCFILFAVDDTFQVRSFNIATTMCAIMIPTSFGKNLSRSLSVSATN